MKITIETADNGYILSYYDEDTKEIRYGVVEEEDNCSSEARTTQKLLYKIMDYFGLWGSKHDTERCYIVVKNQKGEEIED